MKDLTFLSRKERLEALADYIEDLPPDKIWPYTYTKTRKGECCPICHAYELAGKPEIYGVHLVDWFRFYFGVTKDQAHELQFGNPEKGPKEYLRTPSGHASVIRSFI